MSQAAARPSTRTSLRPVVDREAWKHEGAWRWLAQGRMDDRPRRRSAQDHWHRRARRCRRLKQGAGTPGPRPLHIVVAMRWFWALLQSSFHGRYGLEEGGEPLRCRVDGLLGAQLCEASCAIDQALANRGDLKRGVFGQHVLQSESRDQGLVGGRAAGVDHGDVIPEHQGPAVGREAVDPHRFLAALWRAARGVDGPHVFQPV